MTSQGTDVQIMICGSAGDGTIAAGDILRRAMAAAGYKVIAFDLYPPEIRGFGKCISRVRFTDAQPYSLRQLSDVLISLDDSHTLPHAREVRDYGAVIYENRSVVSLREGAHISGHLAPSVLPYGFALRDITEEATGANRSRNITVLGVLAGLLGLAKEPFHETIAAKFARKKQAVTDTNIAAFEAGYAEGATTFKLDHVQPKPPINAPVEGAEVRMMHGNGAVARGCLDAGIECFFGYPITPATSIMERLASEMPRHGGRMVQTEDEISAISATLGAGFAGARAATATSGPGFALMTEMMGLGVMGEVPAVIFVSQRGGPSTGMPTKTEQSDLNIALFGGAGDCPRIVMAPTNVEGCWKTAGKAFELAERYQVPVVVLLDLYLSNRYETVILPNDNPFEPDCRLKPGRQDRGEGYRRFAATENHISPRAIPGEEGGMHVVTGLEHDAFGHPSDQGSVHEAMTTKRYEKLLPALDHPDLKTFRRFGTEGALDVGLLAWGSTTGECLEAMFLAQEEGLRVGVLKVVMLSPLPEQAIRDFMDDSAQILVPELNYEGQFANLVSGRLGRSVVRLNRVPAGPMPVEDILAEIRRLAGRAGAQSAA